MKRLLVLAVVAAASLVGQDVQHAPTVEQCRADQRLWLSSVEQADSPRLPSYAVLSKWDHEMTDCEKVDPENKWKYYNTGSEIDVIEASRLMDFLHRHGLWEKFKEEDAAGKR
jgi:hypothetical protein